MLRANRKYKQTLNLLWYLERCFVKKKKEKEKEINLSLKFEQTLVNASRSFYHSFGTTFPIDYQCYLRFDEVIVHFYVPRILSHILKNRVMKIL